MDGESWNPAPCRWKTPVKLHSTTNTANGQGLASPSPEKQVGSAVGALRYKYLEISLPRSSPAFHPNQHLPSSFCRPPKMTPPTLRWGILGTSFISDVVARAVAASPGSRIQAVFGRDPSRLAAFAARHSVPTQHASVAALLADPSVDVIYVGLPSHAHASAVALAVRAGKKAVLSEKALATTLADARAMTASARAAGDVFLLEGLMYLSHPVMDALVTVLAEGRLGRVRAVSGYYAADIAAKANPRGRGTIYNLGCYPVSLLHLVLESAFGGPAAWTGRRTVLGHGALATSEDGVTYARDAALTVSFHEVGVLATIQSSDSFGNDFGFTIQGDRASLTFVTNPWLPPTGDSVFRIKTYKGGAVETVTVSGGGMDAFGHQVKRVEDCVAAGLTEAPRPSPSWDNSVEIMGLLTEWEEDIFARHGEKIQVHSAGLE